MSYEINALPIVFLYGILIGSFLNVCIYRIPNKQNITTTRSHCMKCGYLLKWYDLIPIVSFILLRGRCRKCGEKISLQYPLIELLNGTSYVIIFLINGYQFDSVLFCLLTSALIVLSMIDYRTFEIPIGINLFIGFLGILRVITDWKHLLQYIAGFFCVSLLLLLLYLITKGRGIGGGDIKLMAAGGLFLGYQSIILAFVLGCILGSVIHLSLMKLNRKERVLAFGPYLSLGMVISMLFGKNIINWYLNFYK